MRSPHFRFSGRYPLTADRERVLALLREPETWPSWWPQVRSVRRTGKRIAEVDIRSALPVTLHLRLELEVDDPHTGVLRAGLAGDLAGWIAFHVPPSDGPVVQVAYEQECLLTKPGVAPLAPVLRPVLTWNHERMMRAGMRALAERAR